MREPNTPAVPTLPHRETHHDDSAGWYESSLLSDLSPSSPQEQSPPPLDIPASREEASAPGQLTPRERVRSLMKMKKTMNSQAATQPEGEEKKKRVDPEPLSITVSGSKIMKSNRWTFLEQPPLPQGQWTPSASREACPGPDSPPLTATSAKSRRSNRFTCLIVEKFLKPDEIFARPEADLETGQSEVVKKRPTHKMPPLERTLEAFLLLLPMLGAMYMLGSSCMPNQWWRERLSIARLTLASGKGEEKSGPDLMLSLWGWCIKQTNGESQCSEPKLLYTMNSFFSIPEFRTKGFSAETFNPTTMRAFVVLLASVAFSVIGTCFVMRHVYARCVKNDRRQEAGKMQHLSILLALLSTGAFWGIRQVFNSQVSKRLGSDMNLENGNIPMLALASIILLAITLCASIFPVWLGSLRRQYLYHRNDPQITRTNTNPDTKNNDPSVDEKQVEGDSDDHVGAGTADQETKNRLTTLGKRMTKFFGSSVTQREEEDGSKFEGQSDPKREKRIEKREAT